MKKLLISAWHMNKRLLIILILLAVFCGQGWGATYYVSQDGAGAKDGSLAAPSAVATFNAGTAPYNDLADDTVYFMDEIISTVVMPVSGSSGHPVTLRGDVPGHTAVIWQFDGNDKNYLDISHMTVLGMLLADGDYCNVANINNPSTYGTRFVLHGISQDATAFDPTMTAAGATINWMLADGTTGSSVASKDYGRAGFHPFAVVVSDASLVTVVNWNADSTVGPLPDLSKCVNLTSWQSYGNQHTGALPDLSKCVNLTSWQSYVNQHTGALPDLSKCVNLRTWYSYDNQHTGALPDLSKCVNLINWYSRSNQHTGPLPDVSKCVNLGTWSSRSNQHTGPLPDLSKCVNLTSWQSYSNQHTGPLPDLSKCVNLTSWQSYSNQHTGISFSSVPATLTNFRMENNLLTQSDVDTILCAFDTAGATGAYTLNVGGTGNAAPSAAGTTCKNALIAKGWTVTTN